VAAALGMLLFLVLANLVVVQYGRGAIRSALEQGVRAGSVGGMARCEQTVESVVGDLLGGRMSDGLTFECYLVGDVVVAEATVVFRSWTALTPDFEVALSSRAVVEP
jgi:hypothetical protein